MQSFIICSRSSTTRDTYITNVLSQKKVSAFDIVRVSGQTSLGIEDIRTLQKQLYLKPLKGQEKAIVLEEAHTLTVEAQNALLKVLEEPPPHVLFFLSAYTADSLLPTILSRCNLIQLIDQPVILSDLQKAVIEEDILLLISESIPTRLFLAEKISLQKDDWLTKSIYLLRENMMSSTNTNSMRQLAHILYQLQEALRLLTTTNSNPRLILEHYFLQC